jgi:hypothetical protein
VEHLNETNNPVTIERIPTRDPADETPGIKSFRLAK